MGNKTTLVTGLQDSNEEVNRWRQFSGREVVSARATHTPTKAKLLLFLQEGREKLKCPDEREFSLH